MDLRPYGIPMATINMR